MSVTQLTTSGVAVLTALILGPAPAPDSAARRCSLEPFHGTRAADETVLLATALPDTMAAGAGTVTPSGAPGHAGHGDARPAFGQVVEVTRHGAADSVVLARAFERRGSTRVVIVPWDYGPDCQPTYWGRSAAWIPVGEAGAYAVALRPDSLWVEGIPTFDAFHAVWKPYPLGFFLQRGYGRSEALHTSPSLTAAEYFDLLRTLPDANDMSTAPDGAWAEVVRWREAHPELAAKFPATRMIRNAASALAFRKARAVLHSIDPPVKGTWRFAFTMDDGPERGFYARTRPRATGGWRDRADSLAFDPARMPPLPRGYSLMVSGALTLDALPGDCTGERDAQREGYIDAAHPPPNAPGETMDWVGAVDLRLLANLFPADSALRLFARDHMMAGSRRYRERGEFERPARFSIGDDGVLRVEQTVRLEDGRSVALRAERVSLDVIACEW